MEPIQTITVIIFLVTIFLVIVRWIDSVVAALLGVIAPDVTDEICGGVVSDVWIVKLAEAVELVEPPVTAIALKVAVELIVIGPV